MFKSSLAAALLLAASAGIAGEADPLSAIPGLRPLGTNARGRLEYLHERTGIVLVSLPGGDFLLGSDGKGEDDERPRRRVTVAPFLLGKFEVTQAQWSRILDWNPSAFQGADRPVENVTWEDCRRFCLRTGLCLPSEAEWEHACRAGSAATYPFGEDPKLLDGHAWFQGNSGKATHPAGGKEPNGFGLHDLLGNVWEWCDDGYHDSHAEAPEDGSPRTPSPGPLAEQRVIRGGCWADTPWCCRSAERGRQPLGRSGPYFGFRAAFRLCPPAVPRDEVSIRAWLGLACRQALALERPSKALLPIGLLEDALLPRDPLRLVALHEGLAARPDGKFLAIAAAMAAGRLAREGRLDLADRLAATLPEGPRRMAPLFIVQGLAARGDAAEARRRLDAIEDPEARRRAVRLAIPGLARSEGEGPGAALDLLAIVDDARLRSECARRGALELARRRRFDLARRAAAAIAGGDERKAVLAHIGLAEGLAAGAIEPGSIPPGLPVPDEAGALADSLVEAGRPEAALAVARAAVDPQLKASTLIGIAEADGKAGRAEAARDRLREARETAAWIDGDLLRSLALMRIAVAQGRSGDREEALATAREVVAFQEEPAIIGFDLRGMAFGSPLAARLELELGLLDLDEILEDPELSPEGRSVAAAFLVWKGRAGEIPGRYAAIEDPVARFHASVGVLRALTAEDEFGGTR